MPCPADRRVTFILRSLQELHDGLTQATAGLGGLMVRHGSAVTEIPDWRLNWVCKPSLPTTTTNPLR